MELNLNQTVQILAMSPSPPTQLTVFLSLSLHTSPYTPLQHIVCSYAANLWWIVVASLSLKNDTIRNFQKQ